MSVLKDLGLAGVIIAGTFAVAESINHFIPKDNSLTTTQEATVPFSSPVKSGLEDLFKVAAPAILLDACDNKENCNVYLSEIISAPQDYFVLANQLATATSAATINIHLSGYGGQASTIYYLTNIIANSKANVVMYIDGDVMSAHAAIALAGKNIVISPLTYFLFHYPAVANAKGENVPMKSICGDLKGKDRGIDNSVNCYEQDRIETELSTTFFNDRIAPYLTKDEIKRYYEGYRILITGSDMIERMKKVHAGEAI